MIRVVLVKCARSTKDATNIVSTFAHSQLLVVLEFGLHSFNIATILFIFHTVCVILSATVSIWSPFLDSKDLENGSGKDAGQSSPHVLVTDLGNHTRNHTGADLGQAPERDPVIDLGKPLVKNTVIDLGYAKYQGVTGNNSVTQWLRIRYAAPPIGDLPFAEPKDPLKHS